MNKGDVLMLAFFALLYRFAEDRNTRFGLSFIIIFGAVQVIFGLHLSLIWTLVCLLSWRIAWGLFALGR